MPIERDHPLKPIEPVEFTPQEVANLVVLAALPKLEAEPTTTDWEFRTVAAADPDGRPLGYVLYCLQYPPNRDDQTQPTSILEVAHFEKPKQAQRFCEEFSGFLMPGVLEGPELAEEVARLEGLPGYWQQGQPPDPDQTQTRPRADWKPYNPLAESDARIASEGIYQSA